VFQDYAWNHRWSFAAGAAALLLTNWLTVSIPMELGVAIDRLTVGEGILHSAISIAWMGALIIIVRTLSRILFFNPGRDIEYRLRRDLMSYLMQLQSSFYADHRTGDIVSRASNDITWARAMVGFGLLQLVNVAIAVPMTGWKMLEISPWLTFVTLIPVILGLLVVQLFIRRLFSLQKQAQKELGDISDHVLESFQGVASIQGFGAEAAFARMLAGKNAAWLRTTMRLATVRSVGFPLLGLSGGLSVFVMLWVGAPMAIRGDISVGDVAAFAALIAALLPPLRSLGWMLSVLQRGRAALERIFELIDVPLERPEGDSPTPCPAGQSPALRVSGLNFAYPDQPDRPVLHDISFEVPAGGVLGVFGRTGSGKSTLLRLISRIYNPAPGTVFVDDVDVTRFDVHAWRKRLAVAPQRPFLFSESIANNVALGSDLTIEAVRRATGHAALDADLEVLPNGIDTVVGQRGIMLSGGQRQRVALARAMARDGDLVVLDDVLSAVDHVTEQRLIAAIRDTGARRQTPPTVVIVSHRQSAIRHADRILVLEAGRVIDIGTHNELVGRPGPYSEAWAVQGQDGASA
jgi:ATP-binding cassette subfamily B multidrug efflux pump